MIQAAMWPAPVFAAGSSAAAGYGEPGTDISSSEEEARLARMRADLLAHLARSPARVLALSWLDPKGALHESTQFFSEAVLFPPGAASGVVPGAAGGCVNALERLRSPAVLSVKPDPLWSSRHPSRAQHVRESVTRLIALRAAERSPAWFAVAGPEEAGTPYWQALTGDVAEAAGWQLEIRLGPQAEGWQFSAELRALDLSAGSEVFARQWQVPPAGFPDVTSTPGPAFQQVLDELVQEVNARVACAGPQYQVTFENGRTPRLMVGRRSGLQVGDRLLLQDRSVLPRHALSPGALGRLAIVEVTAVGLRRTELMPVAGIDPDGQGRWVAVPL